MIKATRRIGVGDRELVRAGLFQVALVDPHKIDEQLLGCLDAVNSIGKTLRIYLNISRHPQQVEYHLARVLWHKYRNHDLMLENEITRARFDWVLGRSDIAIQADGDFDRADIAKAVLKTWQDSGGRDFLNGAARRLTDEQAREKFPEFYETDDELWRRFSSFFGSEV